MDQGCRAPSHALLSRWQLQRWSPHPCLQLLLAAPPATISQPPPLPPFPTPAPPPFPTPAPPPPQAAAQSAAAAAEAEAQAMASQNAALQEEVARLQQAARAAAAAAKPKGGLPWAPG